MADIDVIREIENKYGVELVEALNLFGHNSYYIYRKKVVHIRFENIDIRNWEEFVLYLKKLSGLKKLNLNKFKKIDLEYIKDLNSLEELYLTENQLINIEPLSGLCGLKMLGLGYNSISDISSLASLRGITNLYLHNNKISDISSLAGLTRLKELTLGGNLITDMSPLSNVIKNLVRLDLEDNMITWLPEWITDGPPIIVDFENDDFDANYLDISGNPIGDPPLRNHKTRKRSYKALLRTKKERRCTHNA